MKVYIAGPMRGVPYLNHFRFDAVEKELKETFGKHIEVCNPAQIDRTHGVVSKEGITPKNIHRTLIADCMEFITREATHIYLLEGYEKSLGAQAELGVAELIGLEVIGKSCLSKESRERLKEISWKRK